MLGRMRVSYSTYLLDFGSGANVTRYNVFILYSCTYFRSGAIINFGHCPVMRLIT